MSKNSYDYVIDCSLTMAWCFEDESNEFTDSILESLQTSVAIVPSIWSLEVANVLLIARKHKRISEMQSASFIDALSALPIVVDQSTAARSMHSIFILAGNVDLTIYDAAYLELAIREKIPLLTLNKGLIKAAKKLNIPVEISKLKGE